MNRSQPVERSNMASSNCETNGTSSDSVAGSSRATGSFQVGTAQHYRWLEGVVKAVVVMNLLDAVLTLLWVRAGFATEANPFIEHIVNQSGLVFVVSKLVLVFLGTTLLWRYRTRPLAVMGIFLAFMVYYGILLVHLRFASHLVGQLFAA